MKDQHPFSRMLIEGAARCLLVGVAANRFALGHVRQNRFPKPEIQLCRRCTGRGGSIPLTEGSKKLRTKSLLKYRAALSASRASRRRLLLLLHAAALDEADAEAALREGRGNPIRVPRHSALFRRKPGQIATVRLDGHTATSGSQTARTTDIYLRSVAPNLDRLAGVKVRGGSVGSCPWWRD